MGFLGLLGKTVVGTALCASVAKIALFRGDPQNGGSEIDAPEYTRADTPSWFTGSGYSYNTTVVTWAPPATSSGVASYFALYDSGGTLLGAGQLSTAVTWAPGQPAVTLGVGAITLRPE